jgi:type II secretory pathway pseudopilin PulG
MKAFRTTFIILGVAVLVVAPMLVVDYYKAARSQQEALRMMAVHTMLVGKLEAYKRMTGHYPNSTEALSFTNSPQEIQMLSDIRRIQYRRTESGYALRYDGVTGYNFSEVSTSH